MANCNGSPGKPGIIEVGGWGAYACGRCPGCEDCRPIENHRSGVEKGCEECGGKGWVPVKLHGDEAPGPCPRCTERKERGDG